MYKAIQNWPNLFLCMQGFVQSSINILSKLLKFINDFKEFIHVGKELKRKTEGSDS